MTRQVDVQYVRFYTEGSAARKLEPVMPAKPQSRSKAKRNKRVIVRVDPVAIMGIVVSVLMLVFMLVGVSSLNAARQDTASMEAYVSRLAAENATLTAEYEASYDLEKIEETALALGMVPKDQVTQVTIRVPAAEEDAPGTWDRIFTFLTGLFA